MTSDAQWTIAGPDLAQRYPDDNPKTVVGAAKPGVQAVPPIAIFMLGQAMQDGEKKYGRFNYREKNVSSSTYYNAIMRHLLAWWDGQDVAEDTLLPHLAHIMACCAILLDAESLEKLNDDRKTAAPGALPRWLQLHTRHLPPTGDRQ